MGDQISREQNLCGKMFCDEAKFYTNGRIVLQIIRYSSYVNPYFKSLESGLYFAKIFERLSRTNRSILFHNNVNQHRDLVMLENFLNDGLDDLEPNYLRTFFFSKIIVLHIILTLLLTNQTLNFEFSGLEKMVHYCNLPGVLI